MAEQLEPKPISKGISLRERREKEAKKINEAFSRDLKLTDFEKALLREKYLDPTLSEDDLAKKFGYSKSGIHHHVSKQRFKDASAQLYANVFAQIQALQFKALENMAGFMKFADNEDEPTKLVIKYKASRDMLHAPLTSPASLPAPRRELPEFIDPDSL